MNTAEAIKLTPPTVERVRVTPDLAREWLVSNTRNRPLYKPYVKELKEELLSGRFKETHQGVAFDRDGKLVDGQHRLHAIAEAGVSAWLQVTRGLDPSTFEVIDQVRRRTAAQILTMDGVSKDAPRYAAMARSILTVTRKTLRVSNTEAVQYALAHQDTLGKYLAVARKFSAPVGAAFAWAEGLKWDGVERAAERLMSMEWDDAPYGGADPMRALAKRAESFKALGDGASAAADKFSITVGALSAVNERRGVRKARQSDQDYASLERDSQRASAAAPASEPPPAPPAPVPAPEPAPVPAPEPAPVPAAKRKDSERPVGLKVTGVAAHTAADAQYDSWEEKRRLEAEAFAARVAGKTKG